MKTSFTSLALVSAIAFPSSLAAVIFGATLPVSFGADEALGLFVGALALLTLASDYSQRTVSLTVGAPASGAAASASLATEERRLAA